ncbi:hypothetical protein KP509_23G047500 [Ceratopteris richardii]|uniref:Uncharacterized protein n=1 Tax=Ceratopteris richardii TaxID=49495 RepID=A0A8T2S245_CERRI|nr:hypothetical protein KP509_23G047500 [Ceratopteris richardii]
MQGFDAFSTSKIAPTTPMPAWQKPLDRQESPDALPSLSLGRCFIEPKVAPANSNALHSLSTSANSEYATFSTPRALHYGPGTQIKREETQLDKENLLSFSLSQHYDLTTSLRDQTRPYLRRICAPLADPRMFEEVLSASAGTHESLNVRTSHDKSDPVSVYADILDKPEELASPPYSAVPGEVASDAYKLYSQMFPSTYSPIRGINIQPNPFVGRMCSTEVPTQDPPAHKTLALYTHVNNDIQPEGAKKPTMCVKDERAVSKGLLIPKEEPIFDGTHGTKGLSSYGDACLTRSTDATFQNHNGQVHAAIQRDYSSSERDERNGQLDILHSPSISSKTFDSAKCLGNLLVDEKPAVALKLFIHSGDEQLTECSSTPLAAESLSLECRNGAYETPIQSKSCMDADWGKFLALSATSSGHAESEMVLPFQKRFEELQTFLKKCDEADENERLGGLRSLSAQSRSSYAFALETRAIRLSLEEGKELKRMRSLNVLGKTSESSLEDVGATPQGPRLPVPGAMVGCTHAP